VKRLFDLVASAAALILLSPLLLGVALVVRWSIGSPVLFRQERPGLNGRIFRLLKFRTMSDQTDADGRLLPDEQRLTPVGKFLRSTSLDELPELWNVVRGEMSLVGPRPLLVSYLDRYTEVERRRHEVRPGLTGWAQIHGRNALSWEERLQLDVWYVDHCSLGLDLKIIARTVALVIRRDGVNAPGSATMTEFRPPSAKP
jgi:lipopolysaccharide/colanic/teichoic acid biosynthesis glycosyltransferase